MIENVILGTLMSDEGYARKVLPYLKEEYFYDQSDKLIFNEIYNCLEKYNTLPSKQAIIISIDERDDLTEDRYNETIDKIKSLDSNEKVDENWLLDKTEKFCQDKAVYNAVKRSIIVLDGKDKKYDKGAIPQLLSEALSVSFDTNIGHDFIEGVDDRWEFYHNVEERIKFNLDYFNRITKGGLPNKSLTVCMSGTGVGKTLFMTHCAGANLMDGKNVLYITLEMAEERIAERIDANLLDKNLDDLQFIEKKVYHDRITRLKSKTTGKLIIKEYPTSSANVNHFRFLLNELKMKRNFVPDIIYVDYLNICASARMRMGAQVNSYTYIKAIAEEMRGLAVEFKLPIVTATQTNRSGYSNSDVDLTDTSESFGLPATADFMFALIKTDELEELNQIMVKQLKNRWGDINNPTRFLVGIERAKMRLYDLEDSAQDNINSGSTKDDDVPVMDKTAFGEGMKAERGFGFRGFS